MQDNANPIVAPAGGYGLRDRKKAMRREEILAQARRLFDEKGVRATKMEDIAEAVGVSTPTIFNYFGSKDGILIAMITEGSWIAREDGLIRSETLSQGGGADFGAMLVEIFTYFSTRTLEIAGKRIWRYAEAASIRRPETALAREFASGDAILMGQVAGFLDRYELRLRSGQAADPALLARVFYSLWNAAFLELIRDEDYGLDAHENDIRDRIVPLAEMIFAEEFLRSPTLKPA